MRRTAPGRARLGVPFGLVVAGLLLLSGCGGAAPEPLKPMAPEVPADLCATVPAAAKAGLVTNSDNMRTYGAQLMHPDWTHWRLYVGQMVHKGTAYPGEHMPIVPIDLWTAVEARLAVLETSVAQFAGSFASRQITAQELCVADQGGAQTCITKAQLDALLGAMVRTAAPAASAELRMSPPAVGPR